MRPAPTGPHLDVTARTAYFLSLGMGAIGFILGVVFAVVLR